MQTLTSIQTAIRQYQTGDRPVLVLCSDMQDYVCKYALGGNATNLFCEYVAVSFLPTLPHDCIVWENKERRI